MRRNGIPAFVLVLFLAATGVARADTTDDYVRAQMQKFHVPGLSLVIVKNGAIIKAEGYGLANVPGNVPATTETVYRIASVSKQFIATGIMLLVQEGRLRVDDPISNYLEGTPASWNGITVRHLLTHTSGIVREAPGFDPFKTQSDADVIKSAYPLPLGFTPGEKWEYCNLGYFALGEIIRKVSGQPWSEYLREKVFRPTGMNTTRETNTKETVPNLALGYTGNDNLRHADHWTASRPSGGFQSTVLDLAKWDAVLYTDAILSEATRRQMWSPVILNDGTSYPYGFGWELDPLTGHRQVHHGGSIPGFRSQFARLVDDHLSIIVLMNGDDVDRDSIVRGVANFYLLEPALSATR